MNLISRHIDGVFLAGDPYAITGNYMNQLLENNISVALGTVSHNMDDRLCGVALDFSAGMRKIVDYLFGVGHRKIAYLSAFDERQPDDCRLKSFIDCMKTVVGVDHPIVKMGRPPYYSTVRSGYELAVALLNETNDFTALICTNDMMAFGAISALQQKGLRVPEDVSVVGIDDILFSREFYPSLTTLSHRVEIFGKKVFDILCDNIADKSVVGREIIQPELIVRNSVAPPKN
jgi:DNA-binding LacI/PurR family transcriptional regulator